MVYRTIFEFTEKGFDSFLFLPILFIIIGIGISWFNIRFNRSTSPKKKFIIIFGFIFSGFALLIMLVTIPSSISSRSKLKRIYENKEYQIVEGVIENFHPMPYSGHDVESFTVKDVKFEYSDFILHSGFDQTASHGGPLKENGQQVRLSYIKSGEGNIIIKIELK